MNLSTPTKAWKGLLASFLLPGAGLFFSDARGRGVIWFLAMTFVPLALLIAYNSSVVPAGMGIAFLSLVLILWGLMLYASYRPIIPLHWWGWVLLILGGLGVGQTQSLISQRFFGAFHIPTESMVPTLIPGDDVLVSRFAYWDREPKRGDIVVFKASAVREIFGDNSGREIMYDKRIVGLPGDRIEIIEPRILINGSEAKFGDPSNPIRYTYPAGGRTEWDRFQGLLKPRTESYVVPEGNYFVLGDNSPNSADSRYFGAIPRSAIYGKVTKIYWPPKRMATPQ